MNRLRRALDWLRCPPYPRIAGLLVLLPALAVALLLLLAAASVVPASWAPTEGEVLGPLNAAYSLQAPSWQLATIAILAGLALAAFAVWSDRRVSQRSRASEDGLRLPLSPRNVMRETRGVFAGEVTVTIVIPAHNEEHRLQRTLDGALAQDPAPRRVIVVADNCTDRTEEIARAAGAEVVATVGNTQKKAGALNQVLPVVLEDCGENDLVMVLDADTVLEPGFLHAVVGHFTADRGLMACCGIFYGEQGSGLLGLLQRNEYARYAREIRRRRGKVYVLTGTSSIFRPRALRMVARRRGVSLPGIHGDIYDTAALTEDNELTLALRSLGALMISPETCRVETEVMPTVRALWQQRMRWHRGALENLGAYGMSLSTVLYWMQQLSITYGVLALWGYLGLMAFTGMATSHWVWYPFWLGVGGVFAVERLVTVWRSGWRARLVAALLIPELIYSAFLDLIQVVGIAEIALARTAVWRHLPPPPATGLAGADLQEA